MERHSEALLWTPESEASRSEVLQSKYYTPEYSRAYYTLERITPDSYGVLTVCLRQCLFWCVRQNTLISAKR